jgi:hypothetical protein
MVRYEKKVGNYQALVEFACAIIMWRNIIPVHPGLIWISSKVVDLPLDEADKVMGSMEHGESGGY